MELRPGPYFWKISQGKSPLTIPLGRTPIIIHGCQPPHLAYLRWCLCGSDRRKKKAEDSVGDGGDNKAGQGVAAEDGEN